jgi:hypothetical protein
MDDLRQVLHQAVEPVEPSPDGLERVRHSVKQRRSRQRITAGVVGLTLAAGAIGVAIVALQEDPIDRPGPVSALVPSWSAEVRDAAMMAEVLQDGERVYVPTAQGAVAFAKACDVPCKPIWRADVLQAASERPSIGTLIAVGDGVVAISVEGHFAVFAAECRTDGGLCEPLWRADPRVIGKGYAQPAISEGVVKIDGPREVPGNHVTVAAFEVGCRRDGGVCDPTWTADLGTGTAYYPAPAVDGVFYQQVGRRVLGFAASCRSDGGVCEPDFEIPARGDQTTGVGNLYGPVDIGDELVLVSGGGNIFAYAEHCGTSCSPLWMTPLGGFLDTFPVSAGDVALVQARSGIVAFGAGCRSDGGRCEPRWTFALDSYSPVAYADDRVVILEDGSREGAAGVIALDPSCEGECRPLWSATIEGELQSVASDGLTVVAGLAGGKILGYPVDCSDPCAPVWRARAPGDRSSFLISDERLIVVTQNADELGLTSSLTLRAFEIPSSS